MLELTDTHCHIQSASVEAVGEEHTRQRWQAAGLTGDQLIASAQQAGVTRLLCVGCDLEDSQTAVQFVADRQNCWATIGLHPHEAQRYVGKTDLLKRFAVLAEQPKVMAIGECGLDYFYEHSPKKDQFEILRWQLQLAADHNLPLVFHVREAFDDFWPIFDQFKGLRGVVHSFSATTKELDQILSRGLYVGLNGIMTFTKNPEQLAAAKAVPLDRLVLETDSPFLTPVPFRGKICEPKYVVETARFLCNLRGETLEELAAATTRNAAELFKL